MHPVNDSASGCTVVQGFGTRHFHRTRNSHTTHLQGLCKPTYWVHRRTTPDSIQRLAGPRPAHSTVTQQGILMFISGPWLTRIYSRISRSVCNEVLGYHITLLLVIILNRHSVYITYIRVSKILKIFWSSASSKETFFKPCIWDKITVPIFHFFPQRKNRHWPVVFYNWILFPREHYR